MSRPRLTLIVSNDVPCKQLGTSVDSASWSNRFDPFALKTTAADLWSAYFRERFNSPREVALFCDVSFQTALNWWGAVTAPTSHIALLVMLTDPGAPGFFHDEMRRAAA
ncbi:hypothetical protein PXK17_19945 [Phaeobacter gallaeciensis]|uniref:Uncharacterized protein n=1 Tax=Phaeobacter gallaeciensis TaxID=60890 RepID=A0ABD4XF68_9RHOB|nr:hypothetical protein [Phaeobacter gallaeciensis]MDE4146901.1 hypothetical protein [Phaeobacter gallaeciensis]MDE4163750.1 hypothetical protein [Phaeobacter gallaeciensis]MDE4167985.1 hypothetical protein [Phaeobacter gallaeciensis]MDE4172217.1 hypothetical protein [Phaeobacter gallaeciensis]MDE4180738.1 hypothetical protein [Phaeobacter gallaeciensis]